MPRIPHAAKTLIRQAVERKPQTKATREGEPDGLGVHRTISFNKATSKWLEPLLAELDDPRITGYEVEGGILSVTFSTGIDADDASEFPLDAAAEVAGA